MSNLWGKMLDCMVDITGIDELRSMNIPVIKLDDHLACPVFNVHLSKEISDSFRDMIKFGSLPLPFNRFVIEEKLESLSITCFYLIDKLKNGDGDFHVNISMFKYSKKLKRSRMIVRDLILEYNIKLDKTHFTKYDPHSYGPEYEEDPEGITRLLHRALATLLVRCATKGMELQTEKAPEKVNKKRLKNGKTPISDTIYMRPSHYYDSDNVKHSIDGKSNVRIHWRRGHLRRVHHGKGRSLIKQVYISPSLVNYKEGCETPIHKTRVV